MLKFVKPAAVAVLLSLIGASAHAEIDKVPMPTGADHYAWWPKLNAPKGWKAAPDLSKTNGVNVLLPAADSPAKPSAMLYANAVASNAVPLDDFIRFDLQSMSQDDPSLQFLGLPPVVTADGRVVRVFQLDPGTHGGDYELMGYVPETSADGDFIVSFVLSTSSPAGRQANSAAFYKLVGGYTK